MSKLPAHIGIRFHEIMSGFVNPAVQPERAGLTAQGFFAFDLTISIDSLQTFLDAPEHVAAIHEGQILWDDRASNNPVRPGGSLKLFRKDAQEPKRKFFDFRFSFPTDSGEVVDAEGHKTLFDDAGFDAAADMSRVALTLSEAGIPTGTGIVQVHISELFRQLDSIVVTGTTSPSEQAEAKRAFFAFMNHEIREVYPAMPLLFRDDSHLSREEWRTLSLCARIMLPERLPAGGPDLEDVLKAIESFLANTSATPVETIRRWLRVVGVLAPFLEGHLAQIRAFVAKVFAKEERSDLRSVCELLHVLIVFPYYAHPKADGIVGYKRPLLAPRNNPDLPVQPRPPARVFDVVIAGAGPAGSLLAQRLSRQGKSVLLLEAGPYVPERTVKTDEVVPTARLYKESGLQRANESKHRTLQVLQGSCVGGGGMINNVVCFRLPTHRLRAWQDIGFPLSDAILSEAYDHVAADLDIGPISERAEFLNPAVQFLSGLGPVHKPPILEPPAPGLFECLVNVERRTGGDTGCISSGLCNVACGSERKRNALQVYLPQAMALGCVLVPNAKVVDILLTRRGLTTHVESLKVELTIGSTTETVRVAGREFVLCAGAVGSSATLLRAGEIRALAEDQNIPIGKRFAANLGSPLFAFARSKAHERPSIQIAHYFVPPDDRDGFVLETWFNPPGANATTMPGFMQDHFERMQRYAFTVAAAPLVGSRPAGSIDVNGNKTEINLPFGSYERERMSNGLQMLANAFLNSGKIDFVLASYGNGRRLATPTDVGVFIAEFKRRDLLNIGTGHPQGGNAMSADPLIGVVDGEFRVRGIANLRVCDASIFPDSAGVNPQWTVMALAAVCANAMA